MKSQALPALKDAAYRVHAEAGVPNISTMGALALLVRHTADLKVATLAIAIAAGAE